MAEHGPPRKPTALKLLQGIPGEKHRLNLTEPKPKKAPPAELRCPSELSEDGKKYWKKYAPRLYRNGLLTENDAATFKRLCELQSDYAEARKLVKEKGEYYPVYQRLHLAQLDRGEKPKVERLELFPHAKRLPGLLDDILRLEKEFGMTPASRSSISVSPTANDALEVEEKLFGSGSK